MTNYVALQSLTTESPVLFFNADAPLSDLCAFASARLRAARDLTQTLTCAQVSELNQRDVVNVLDVLHTLLDDGCTVLSRVEQRTRKQAG